MVLHAQLNLAVSRCKGGFLHVKKKSNGVLVTVSDEANETLRTLIGPYADAIGKEKKFSRAKRVSRQKHSFEKRMFEMVKQRLRNTRYGRLRIKYQSGLSTWRWRCPGGHSQHCRSLHGKNWLSARAIIILSCMNLITLRYGILLTCAVSKRRNDDSSSFMKNDGWRDEGIKREHRLLTPTRVG